MGKALGKFAKSKSKEWDGGAKGQVSLGKMLKDENVKREQYTKAGVKDENSNIQRMKDKKSKIFGLSVPTHPVRNVINMARQKIESKEHQSERFGKAYDKFRSKKQ